MLTDKDFTHVILGRSTAGSIKYAFKINKDHCLVSNDQMTVGRQNLSASLKEWQSARHQALKTTFGENFYNLESDESSKLDLFDNFHLLHKDKSVLFWADSHISTHAMIAFIVYHAITNNLDCSQFYIIRFFATDTRLWGGLAVQTPADLISNRPKIRKLSKEEIANYLRFWQVFACDNLLELIQTVSSKAFSKSLDVPLGHLLRRLPSRKNGLDVIDEMLLSAAISYAPQVVMAVAHVLGHDDSPDRQGDTYLFQRLLKFSFNEINRPLLRIGNDFTSMRDCKMTTLPLAHEILAGRANMIALNGLDDWLGGVHLTPDNVVYREDLATMGGSK